MIAFRHCVLFASVFAVYAITTTARAQQQPGSLASTPDQPTFRASVELVVLSVTVLDARKRFVAGLDPEDFEVYENGVRQDLSFFGLSDVPVDVALLLDVSSSMGQNMQLVRKAATGFLRTLRRHDRATIIGFSDRVEVLQSLTGNIARLARAIERTHPRGSTALYDAVYITVTELERERNKAGDVRRPVLVILSDGHDTASLSTGDDTLKAVHRSGVTVYTIALKQPETTARSPRRDWSIFEADFTLKALAKDSGGRAFSINTVTQLQGVYEVIAADIAHQYVLGYVPQSSHEDRTLKQLSVRVASRTPAREVRTRRGYYAAAR